MNITFPAGEKIDPGDAVYLRDGKIYKIVHNQPSQELLDDVGWKPGEDSLGTSDQPIIVDQLERGE
jgi:hypothetical protein